MVEFDHVEPAWDKEPGGRPEPIWDGIRHDVLRSDRTSMKIPPEKWCGGAPKDSPWHHWSNTLEKFCTICGRDYAED